MHKYPVRRCDCQLIVNYQDTIVKVAQIASQTIMIVINCGYQDTIVMVAQIASQTIVIVI